MALLRSHGITRDAALLEKKDEGGWYYEQQCLGFNYRMTDMQAALGSSQLQRLDTLVARRHAIADRYDALLADLPLILPVREADRYSGLHLYVIQIDESRTARRRREVFDGLRTAGIGVNVHYIPVHLQPDFRKLGFQVGDFPLSEAYYRRCISLPMFPDLSEEAQDVVVAALRELLA